MCVICIMMGGFIGLCENNIILIRMWWLCGGGKCKNVLLNNLIAYLFRHLKM